MIDELQLEKLEKTTLDDIKNDSDTIPLSDVEIDKHTKMAMRTRVAAWTYNNMYNDSDYTIEEVYNMINNVAKQDIRQGAALALLYLSGSRIGEILESKFKDGTRWPGIRQRDIKIMNDGYGDVLTIKTIVEKHNDNYGDNLKSHYKFRFKTGYIPLVPLYQPFFDILQAYSETIEDDDPELPLFKSLNYGGLRHMWNRWGLKCGFHVIRHWRASHLAKYHGYSEVDLRVYFGWAKTSDLPTRYTHNDQSALINKCRKNLMER